MTCTKREFKTGVFYHGDCLEILNEEKLNFDICITSPPYDDLRTYNNSSNWNISIFEAIAKKLAEKLNIGSTIVWIVNDQTVAGSETGNSFRQALFFKDECGLNIHDTMIWNKLGFTGVGSIKTRYGPIFEYMFIFTKGKIKTFNPFIDRPNKWAGYKTPYSTRQKNGAVTKNNNRKIYKPYGIRFNIWENLPHNQQSEKLNHPAPFPTKLIEDHIYSWSNNNETILDIFAGSGTTAIAAMNTSRKWICIEKDKDYFDKACERIEKREKELGL